MNFDEYTEKYGIRLDPDQRAACADTEGHVLLLAVPGSGKTTVMTARLGYLVRGLGVPPPEILAVTYSVAGAYEMQKRYMSLFGRRDVEIRTINGFCAKLINTYTNMYRKEPFTLIDGDGDISRILRSLLAETGQYPSENELNDIRTAMTYSRNMLLSDEDASKEFEIEGYDIAGIMKRYREFKIKNRLMDYDDQLAYGYSIMRRYPEVKRAYSDKFRYICVDEAQDTSKIQHLIIRLAAEKHGNLFMVGDEDQSIYGFRAAYPEALLDFDSFYPDARVYFISRNYRSTKAIVSAADGFISSNTNRRKKNMTTENPDGEKITRTYLSDLSSLPDYILKKADNCRGEYGRTAVLCRLNDSLIPIVDILSANGVPFRMRATNGLFFTHFIVCDIKDILSFAYSPHDITLFSRLYYKFSAGMSRADFDTAKKLSEKSEGYPIPELISESKLFDDHIKHRMKTVSRILRRIRESDTATAIRLMISDIGYGTYLKYKTNDVTKVNTLLALAMRYRTRESFLERLDELSGIMTSGSESENGIVLSSIHSSKGLEFDKVYICDAKDGILPALTEPQRTPTFTEKEMLTLEEERRVFYVAVTRAKKELEFVTYASEFSVPVLKWSYIDSFMGAAPVKLKNGPPTFEEMKYYCVGAELFHRAYGRGRIVEKHGDIIYVRFDSYPDPKKLSLYICLKSRIINTV